MSMVECGHVYGYTTSAGSLSYSYDESGNRLTTVNNATTYELRYQLNAYALGQCKGF